MYRYVVCALSLALHVSLHIWHTLARTHTQTLRHTPYVTLSVALDLCVAIVLWRSLSRLHAQHYLATTHSL